MHTSQHQDEKGRASYLRNVLLFILLAALVAPCYAAPRKTFSLIGLRTCMKWTIDRKNSRSRTGIEMLSDVGDRDWLLGYLSSLNDTSGGALDVLDAVDAETVFLWTDKYCAEHPNKDLHDAAWELFIALYKIEVKRHAK